jgi:hypothetical protein
MLRIEIAGRWSAKDFADFYEAMDVLYSMYAVISVEMESARDLDLFYSEFLKGR